MPKVRGNPAEKWSRRASAATPDYAAGVQSPRTSWQQATVAAAQAQAAGVQAAIQRGSFAKGVNKAGDAKWQAKALSKGQGRYAGGVQDAMQDYEAGFAPYRNVIERTALPARGPKGDPRNLERVRVIAAALRAAKVGGSTPGGGVP